MKKILSLIVMVVSVLIQTNAQGTLSAVKVFELDSEYANDVYNMYIDSVSSKDDNVVFCFSAMPNSPITVRTDVSGNIIDLSDSCSWFFTIYNGDSLLIIDRYHYPSPIINSTTGDTVSIVYDEGILAMTASSSGAYLYTIYAGKRKVPYYVYNVLTGQQVYSFKNSGFISSWGLCCSDGVIYILHGGTLTYANEDGSNIKHASVSLAKVRGIGVYRGWLYLYNLMDNSVYRLELPRNIETAVGSFVETDGMKEAVHYGLDGRITDPSTPGVHIIRFPDGTVSKTIVTRQ